MGHQFLNRDTFLVFKISIQTLGWDSGHSQKADTSYTWVSLIYARPKLVWRLSDVGFQKTNFSPFTVKISIWFLGFIPDLEYWPAG